MKLFSKNQPQEESHHKRSIESVLREEQKAAGQLVLNIEGNDGERKLPEELVLEESGGSAQERLLTDLKKLLDDEDGAKPNELRFSIEGETPAAEETPAEPVADERSEPDVKEEPAAEETPAEQVTEEESEPDVKEEPAAEETPAEPVAEEKSEPAVNEEPAAEETPDEPIAEEKTEPDTNEGPAAEETDDGKTEETADSGSPEPDEKPEEEKPEDEPLPAVTFEDVAEAIGASKDKTARTPIDDDTLLAEIYALIGEPAKRRTPAPGPAKPETAETPETPDAEILTEQKPPLRDIAAAPAGETPQAPVHIDSGSPYDEIDYIEQEEAGAPGWLKGAFLLLLSLLLGGMTLYAVASDVIGKIF